MKIRILGCGTSTGVPKIGNEWGRCDPEEPRNRRTRSSILLESGDKRLLVDCGPDLREQMLAAEVDRIDAVIVTHDHADHCHGIDDLRPFAQTLKAPLPVLARPEVLERLQQRFTYAFVQAGYYPPLVDGIELADALDLGDCHLRFVDQPHGGMTSTGIRIEEAGRSAAYAVDFNALTDEMAELYRGVDVWICDCLMERPHPTHAHLDAVLTWARKLEVGRVYLTHMGNGLDYRSLVESLPEWAAPAHDGLEICLA